MATEYFAGGDPDGWLYLGRWTGEDWERARESGQRRDPAIDATDVVVLEIGIAPIDGRVGATIELCGDDRPAPVISPNARAPQIPGFGYRSVAFAADWDAEPRPVAEVDADVAAYVKAGVDAFDGARFDVDAASGKVRQIVVADLDGDRDSESLVVYGGADFSALLLIDADSGDAVTVAIDGAQPIDAPSQDTTATSIGGSTTTTTEPPPPPPISKFRTLAVGDLNGDGLMEFVSHRWNEENEAAVRVHTYDGSDVATVLRASC